MNVYKIDNGSVDCYVMAYEKDQALNLKEVKDYFCDDIEPLHIKKLPKDAEITVRFGCGDITHTAYEWIHIYEGEVSALGVNQAKILCSSEY